MAADGSMVAPVGWGGASHTMNDFFEGGRGRDSPPVTVVELGAGVLLFGDVCGLQSGLLFFAVRHRNRGSCHGLRVRWRDPSGFLLQQQNQRRHHEQQQQQHTR